MQHGDVGGKSRVWESDQILDLNISNNTYWTKSLTFLSLSFLGCQKKKIPTSRNFGGAEWDMSLLLLKKLFLNLIYWRYSASALLLSCLYFLITVVQTYTFSIWLYHGVINFSGWVLAAGFYFNTQSINSPFWGTIYVKNLTCQRFIEK